LLRWRLAQPSFTLLFAQYKSRTHKYGSFSAAVSVLPGLTQLLITLILSQSNVTGILTDQNAVTALLHKYVKAL
jgi:hypothetical protein